MATFKAGDRVKRVQVICGLCPLGETGTFIGYGETFFGHQECEVRWDNALIPSGGWWVETLAPLTDPKAEAFLESIRQLKPLPVQEIA